MASFLSVLKIHPKIFYRYPQKAETFTILFHNVFMMLFMCSPDGHEIGIFGGLHYAYPLMDENIMNEKVRHSVKGNTQTKIKFVVEVFE